MKEDVLIMSKKERRYKSELDMVLEKRKSLTEASRSMRVSYRQGLRLKRSYEEAGDIALVHKSRGKMWHNPIREEVLQLYEDRYFGYGPTLAAEKLLEDGYALSRETVRQWLKQEGLHYAKRKRAKHRQRRERKSRFRELVQMDGSIHDWLGIEGKKQCLMNMVDDATGKTMALLGTGETTELAFLALKMWIEQHGIPMAIYVDLKGTYVSPKTLSRGDEEGDVDEDMDSQWYTHFSRACGELGIEIIKAYSPQAKGRVERNHGVYQDRFVKELRLHGITSIEGANELLLGGFVDKLNNKFMKQPEKEEDAHVSMQDIRELDGILCWQYERSISKDYVVRFRNRFYQLSKQNEIYCPTRQKVLVKRFLDGRIELCHDEKGLDYKEIEKPRPKQVVKVGRSSMQRSMSARASKGNSPWSRYNNNWLKPKDKQGSYVTFSSC